MRHIKARIKAWQGFFEGKYSLWVVLELMLPRNMRTFTELEHEVVICNQYHVELIKENAFVVDAGANIGVFSIFAAQKHPNCTIYAFEPTPSTYKILVENTKGYPNIKCFNHGLGDKNENSSIIEDSKDIGANRIGKGGIPCEIKTIDSLGISMDFLKMDTEGYEGQIMKGAAETIKKYKPIIVMSAYHHPEDKVELPKILNSIVPYNCELRHDCEEDFICKPI